MTDLKSEGADEELASTHIEFGDYTVLDQRSRIFRQMNFGYSAQGHGKAEQNKFEEVATKAPKT